MGFVPELVVFVPIRLRNQIWDEYHFSGARNCISGTWRGTHKDASRGEAGEAGARRRCAV